jgi:hypothetical protein
VQEILAVVTLIVSALSVFLKMISVEKAIYDEIAETRQNHQLLHEKVYINESIYKEQRELFIYQIHGLNEKIDQKFNRLFQELKDLKSLSGNK